MTRFVVAVTGGIASGKSAVTARFEALGVPVVDADIEARNVVAPGEPALSEIAAAFGRQMLLPDGTLDRAALRALVFTDAAAKRQLEAITHPRIRLRLQETCAAVPGAYVIAAIPLLAEVGARAAYPWLARVLVVDAPVGVQRSRLQARDGIDAKLADHMIQAQASRPDRLRIASDVLVNDGAPEDMILPVDRLHRLFLRLSQVR